jgi:hypothetical protein
MKKLQSFNQFNEALDFKKLNLDNMESEGDNHFAIALHRLTKFPIYCLRVYYENDATDEVDSSDHYQDEYMAVKLPNGNFLSSAGEKTFDELEDKYASHSDLGKITMVEIDEVEAINSFVSKEYHITELGERDETKIKMTLDRINRIIGLQVAKWINNVNEALDFNKLYFSDSEYDGNVFFAVALHRLTKFPIYTLRCWFTDETLKHSRGDWEYDHDHEQATYEDVWNGVQVPNGNLLSTKGERTPSDLIKSHGNHTTYQMASMVKLTEFEAMTLYSHKDHKDTIDMGDEDEVQMYLDQINRTLGLQLAVSINDVKESVDKSIYSNWSIKKGNDNDFSNSEFITLYRSEGNTVSREKLPKSTQGSSGTWFTPNLKEVERYNGMNKDRKIYKLDIPLTLYNNLLKMSKNKIEMSKGEVQLPLDLSILKTLL